MRKLRVEKSWIVWNEILGVYSCSNANTKKGCKDQHMAGFGFTEWQQAKANGDIVLRVEIKEIKRRNKNIKY